MAVKRKKKTHRGPKRRGVDALMRAQIAANDALGRAHNAAQFARALSRSRRADKKLMRKLGTTNVERVDRMITKWKRS